jgi:signal transduction histidine kinase
MSAFARTADSSRTSRHVRLVPLPDSCIAANGRTIRSVRRRSLAVTQGSLGNTGLGLHIVHNVVTNCLGGRVNLDSEPGEGTKFQLMLPRVAPAGPAAQ